ncbi:hypothetical protein E2542_SST19098 [Spatholobus suberectus]|nr:hypothetical protein E2542_SST19093 [Spatholobus suberectus]TKY54686.1 hypothetical protein E2542_SST19098 [Spatholobus suberectus]
MSKTLVTWFFLLFSILTYSAYGSTSCTADTGNFRTSKPQKEPKPMYGVVMESSKPCIQRTFPELHAAQQTRISRFARAIYRGPTNVRPSKVRNASNSYSIKPPSLFMAALGHLAFGLLLVHCFYRIP